ncbi:bromodomain-containing protein 4-like [Dermacentor silvarum]|uniref:bromodomain-containing protein 4-like n=1 Tax=Dermacentor silvarum TaxID=543639 RepID=UPI001897C64F|nr:bromodomain-containing protein 4-like [Dermacentor silvarum]
MLSQVIVMVCATVAAVRSNVGTMGPNYGGASQQAQQAQPQPPLFQYHPSFYPPPLPYPSYHYSPSPYQLSHYQPELCPPQPCQPPQLHHGLHSLSSHMGLMPTSDGGFFFNDPRGPADLGHYRPSPGERDPNEPVIMALGRSNGAVGHSGGGPARTRRHVPFAGQHTKH